jgi:hypothetical protein
LAKGAFFELVSIIHASSNGQVLGIATALMFRLRARWRTRPLEAITKTSPNGTEATWLQTVEEVPTANLFAVNIIRDVDLQYTF